MKVGIRKPSIKKSISARTTGKAKRKLKRMVNPLYGKKGMGFLKNPGKAIKGKIYRKTTMSTKKAAKGLGGCLVVCFVGPFYLIWYTLVLMWYMMKYLILGTVWLFVFIVNGCISFVEWCINHGKKIHEQVSAAEQDAPMTEANSSECVDADISALDQNEPALDEADPLDVK